MRRLKWVAMFGAFGVLTFGGHAHGATTIGQTSASTRTCGAGFSEVQRNDAGTPTYAVPAGGGVITRWSTDARPGSGQLLKLKVFRHLSGSDWLVVGQSSVEELVPSQFNTFATRIPVQAGDRLGQAVPPTSTEGGCLIETSSSSDTVEDFASDDPDGARATGFVSQSFLRLNISAVVEPDTDGDAFGDETQDACPTDGSTQGACRDVDPPETTITKDAPKRIDTDKVKFRFESDEASSTFECKLKGKDLKRRIRQFNDCDSPRRYRNLDEGRYRFKVRAIDAAGNVDLTPAKDRFRVLD